MVDPHPNILHLQGKEVVIIGDGPAAFITAIKLKQKGILNITIVGPRIGEFTRSGDYQWEVFKEISSTLAPIKIIASSGWHIKDVERQLHDHAEKLGIKLIKKKFVNFSINKLITVTDVNDQSPETLHADILYDCTGTKREVINKFNEKRDQPFFDIVSILKQKQPVPFAMIRANLSRDELDGIKTYARKPGFVDYVLTIEELRKLGWSRYDFPEFYAKRFPNKKSSTMFKANIYLELPQGLSQQDTIKFVKKILKLATGKSSDTVFDPDLILHADSKKYPKKQIISNYFVNPHQTTPGYFPGNNEFPAIFHAGDASADLPFFLGAGLLLSTKQIDAAVNSMKIKGGAIIAIDQTQFEKSFEENMKEHFVLFDDWQVNEQAKQAKWANLEEVISIYELANRESVNPQAKSIIVNGLKSLQHDYVLELYAKATSISQDISDDTNGLIHDSYDKIEEIIRYFKSGYPYKDVLSVEEKNEMQSTLQDLAERCNILGSFYYESQPPKLSLAQKYYQIALKIHADLIEGDNQLQKLISYSNLIFGAYKNHEFERVQYLYVRLNDNVNAEVINDQNNKLILDKVYLYSGVSYLKNGQAMLKNNQYNKDEFEIIVHSIKDIISKMSDSSKEFVKSLESDLNELIQSIPEKKEKLKNPPKF